MGQFSLVVSTAADLSEFTFNAADNETFETYGGLPTIQADFPFTWDTPGTSADVDYYVKWANNGDDRVGRYGGPACRMASEGGGEDCYLVARGGAIGRISAYKIPADVELGSVAAGYSTGFYWTRLYVQGTSIKIKTWTGELADEPGGLSSNTNWDIETTDSDYTAAGYVGHSSEQIATETDFYFSEFYVGTNGDLAPVGGGGTTVSPLGKQSLNQSYQAIAASRLNGVLQ